MLDKVLPVEERSYCGNYLSYIRRKMTLLEGEYRVLFTNRLHNDKLYWSENKRGL
jgi:hypothetical protein